MATRTPPLQTRSRFHRDWGNFTSDTLLPNASGAPLAAAMFDLEAGDQAFNDGSVGGLLSVYVCISAGTAGGGDAVWRPVGLGAQLGWGNDSIGNGLATRYLAPGWDDGLAATVTREIRLTRDVVFTDIYARHSNPGGSGATITYTLRLNGIASAVTVALATTASNAATTGLAVAGAAGDVLDLEVTRVATAGGGQRRPGITVGYL